VSGRGARRYCTTAHRAAGQRLRDQRAVAERAAAGAEPELALELEPGPLAAPGPLPGPEPVAAAEWAGRPALVVGPEPEPPGAPGLVRGAAAPAEEPAPAAPWPSAAQPAGPTELTEAILLRPRSVPPSAGWRRAVFLASKGRLNPGPNRAELARRELLARVGRPLPGTHRVAVCSLKGGVGKTTVSALLGLTLAEHRGDRILALDASPDAGTLADRLIGQLGPTVRQLLDRVDGIDSLSAVCDHTASAGRLRLLASEQEPANGAGLDRGGYERVAAALARFFNIIVTDCGTGLAHPAMAGAFALADSLVVVGSPTVDGASRAARTLDWLLAHGHDKLAGDAVVVLCGDRTSREVAHDRLLAHFAARCRAVLEVPYDSHLATGGRLDLAALQEPTQAAFLRLAALIADRF